MQRRLSTSVMLLLTLSLIGLTACNRSGSRVKEAPITGKRSDPAVAFVGRWDATNDFAYRLEALTGTQVPRRNSDVVVQQDTSLAQDFRLSVTNVAPDGSRAMVLEIQSVQIDTTSDQRLTSAFDTENELISLEDNPVGTRLQRVKGARLGFRLSPANRVIRVEGVKEFNERVGANRSVRGVAGAVLNRFFNQQFYRDLLDLGFLPTNAVHIGESWTARIRSMGGLYNNPTTDLTYTFRGWQLREGTNCARFDFTGVINPPSPPSGRASAPAPTNFEEASLKGTTWFSPDLGVPVEISFDQSLTRHISSSKPLIRTNAPPSDASASDGASKTNIVVDMAVLTRDPSSQVTRTTTSQQHVTLLLVEVIPMGEPGSRR